MIKTKPKKGKLPETYSEPCQTSKIELFVEIA